MAYIGLLVPSPGNVNNAACMVIFSLAFIANTLVPSSGLPAVLRTVADWNPVSAVTQAARSAFGNLPSATPRPTVWSLAHPDLYTMAWVALLLVAFDRSACAATPGPPTGSGPAGTPGGTLGRPGARVTVSPASRKPPPSGDRRLYGDHRLVGSGGGPRREQSGGRS